MIGCPLHNEGCAIDLVSINLTMLGIWGEEMLRTTNPPRLGSAWEHTSHWGLRLARTIYCCLFILSVAAVVLFTYS